MIEHKWKCNACGAVNKNHSNCPCCKAPTCIACKQANGLVNVTELQRMVSHSAALPASQLRKRDSKKQSKPRVKRQKQTLESLLATVNQLEKE
jgi:predicted ATP-dependent serine protease